MPLSGGNTVVGTKGNWGGNAAVVVVVSETSEVSVVEVSGSVTVEDVVGEAVVVELLVSMDFAA